ncbi:MAG: F0F1 ATP synthase subunit alpha [Patescibacteria group bacterium]
MSYEIIEKLKRDIEGFRSDTKPESVGKVIEVGDGVLKVSGLSKAMSQESLTIETTKGEVQAVAFNLEETTVGAIALGDFSQIKVGDTVKPTGQVLAISLGREMIGRGVDPLGQPVDGKGPIFLKEKPVQNPVEKRAPSVLPRESVNTPLHTGIKAIDSMIPIGRGQRELIIGDRQTGKTSIAIDAIINQAKDAKHRTPICIYVAIGQKQANIAKVVRILEEAGAMKYSIVVAAPAGAPATLWYLAPYAGCAIGEYFMEKGEDALIVYDDLSKHAASYRQISLLLRRPPGREAYPGDVFYLHSRLLERAAKMDKAHGGGSLTALPIIETQLGDVSAYVPTNVISITDGQIFLESDLFYQGIRPAVNAGLSVSRVGSSAQTKAVKKVAGKLRLELAQFRELQAFVQFASDLDEATRAKIKRGQLLVEILKQPDGSPMSFERQAVVFYAALRGYLNEIPVDKIITTERALLEYIENLHDADILKPIRESGDLVEAVEEKLKQAITRFLETIK